MIELPERFRTPHEGDAVPFTGTGGQRITAAGQGRAGRADGRTGRYGTETFGGLDGYRFSGNAQFRRVLAGR